MASIEAWFMDDSDEDHRMPHKLNPNEPVSLKELENIGVFYWKLDADIYETDPALEKIRKDRGYSYSDIITIDKDKLPNYEDKLKMFFEEHLHLDDEIRYILDGRAYFDVRDREDRWIRIAMTKGDLITLPAGIYHRFTLTETNYTQAMRLFVGEPVWKAYNRPADEFDIRQKYVMEMINENSKARGRVIDFKEIKYGYRRVDPMHGAEYILDLLLLYKKHKGRKVTVPVRRHAYLQQSFSRPFFSESEELDVVELVEAINTESQSFSFLSNSLKIFSPFQFSESTREMRERSQRKVNILVPLTGRYDIFLRFMENFEKICLIPKQNVKLAIILVDNDSNQDREKHLDLIKEYSNKYPKADLSVIPMTGDFSRGLALELGSSQLDNDTLLFFCDVDLVFNGDALQRCRHNTIQRRQAYYPVVFSQYDPKIVYAGNTPDDSSFVFTKKSGFWRDYGFGITCIFKSDLQKAGGFDTSIQGWGLEDVDLFTKVINSGLKVFRSQEPGIVHIYHPVQCDTSLEPKQYKMCLGSKASTYASSMQLAELWLEKHLGVGYNRTST